MMRRIVTVAAILATGLLMTGCASFEGKLLAPIQQFPSVAQPERPSVNIDLKFRQYVNGAPVYFMTKTAEGALEKKCTKRFVKSALYSQVGTDLKDADIDLVVNLKDDGHASMGMAFLTGLSLYIIPSFATDTFKLQADITDRRDKSKRSVELEDFVTQYQQILLLPLLPFKMTPMVAGKVQNTLFDNLALQVFENNHHVDDK
jgi:hypothetical protein